MAQVCVPWDTEGGFQECIEDVEGFATGRGLFQNLGTILTGSPSSPYHVGLFTYIVAISGIILIFMIISAGYTYLTSAGNSQSMEKAKKRLTVSILGFIIILSAYWIWQLVALFLGFGTAFPSPY